MKPKDLGISPYFTLDETSKLEQVYLELHPEQNIGDSGSSTPRKSKTSQSVLVQPSSAPANSLANSLLAAIPEEVNRRNSFRSERTTSFDDDDEDDEEAFAPIRTTSEPIVEMVEEIKFE